MKSVRYQLASTLLGLFMVARAFAGEVTVGEAAPDFRLQDQKRRVAHAGAVPRSMGCSLLLPERRYARLYHGSLRVPRQHIRV